MSNLIACPGCGRPNFPNMYCEHCGTHVPPPAPSHPPPAKASPVAKDIGAFLDELGIGQYQSAFQANGITPDLLDTLTDAELQSLGVTVLGHRKLILKASKPPEPTPAPAPVAPAPVAHSSHYGMPMPPSYLWQAIVVTLFCCLPFGIISIIHASSVSSHYHADNWELATYHSNQARTWANWGVGIWFIFGFLYFGLVFLGLMSSI